MGIPAESLWLLLAVGPSFLIALGVYGLRYDLPHMAQLILTALTASIQLGSVLYWAYVMVFGAKLHIFSVAGVLGLLLLVTLTRANAQRMYEMMREY